MKDDERIKQGENAEENGYLPKVQSKSSKPQSTLLHVLISASFLWYPFACLLIAVPFTLLTSYFVSDESLLYFVGSYLMACYLFPAVAFVALFSKSHWFRRWCHWFLLTWIGINMFSGITESVLTRFCFQANTEFQQQFKPTTN